jgi:hypothetical protein
VVERTAAKDEALSHPATTDEDQGCPRYADGIGPRIDTPGSVKPIVGSRSLRRSKWGWILADSRSVYWGGQPGSRGNWLRAQKAEAAHIRHRVRRLREPSFRPSFERISDPHIPPTRRPTRTLQKVPESLAKWNNTRFFGTVGPPLRSVRFAQPLFQELLSP